MDTKDIRAMLGVSRAEYSRRYHIPVRTLEDWEHGKRKPPDWVLFVLERLAKMDTKYGHETDGK